MLDSAQRVGVGTRSGAGEVAAAEDGDAEGGAELLDSIDQAGGRADLLRAHDLEGGGDECGVNSPTSIPMTPSAPSRGAEEVEGR